MFRNITKIVTNFRRVISTPYSTQVSRKVLNFPETKVSQLSNGLRIVSEDLGTPTCTVGLWIDAGSRYETQANNGVAHFLEHMLFKGTDNRSREDIDSEIEDMGAHLNASTSREQTIYHVKCFTKDVRKAMDILSDIIQNSKCERPDIEIERAVILREMQEIENNHMELVFDHLHSAAFQNTSLGHTILGPVVNIKHLSREDLLAFKTKHYVTSKMVIACAGGVQHEELVKVAEECFRDTPSHSVDIPSDFSPSCKFTGSESRLCDQSMPLVRAALAVEGCGWMNPESIPLQIANILIGSWDRSQTSKIYSELAHNVRATNLCRSFFSFNTVYKDTGLWGIYVVSEENTFNDLLSLIQKKWHRLCTSVTDEEVSRAKNLLCHSLRLSDGTTPMFEDIGREIINYNRRIPLPEMEARIKMISPDIFREVCSSYLKRKPVTIAAVGPIENMMDYGTLQRGMQ